MFFLREINNIIAPFIVQTHFSSLPNHYEIPNSKWFKFKSINSFHPKSSHFTYRFFNIHPIHIIPSKTPTKPNVCDIFHRFHAFDVEDSIIRNDGVQNEGNQRKTTRRIWMTCVFIVVMMVYDKMAADWMAFEGNGARSDDSWHGFAKIHVIVSSTLLLLLLTTRNWGTRRLACCFKQFWDTNVWWKCKMWELCCTLF